MSRRNMAFVAKKNLDPRPVEELRILCSSLDKFSVQCFGSRPARECNRESILLLDCSLPARDEFVGSCLGHLLQVLKHANVRDRFHVGRSESRSNARNARTPRAPLQEMRFYRSAPRAQESSP